MNPVQSENAALRQHVLDLRRAARAAGCALNSSITYFPLPGLEDALGGGRNATTKGTQQDLDDEVQKGRSKPLEGGAKILVPGDKAKVAVKGSSGEGRMVEGGQKLSVSDKAAAKLAVTGGKRRYRRRRRLLGLGVKPVLRLVSKIAERYQGLDLKREGFEESSLVQIDVALSN